jgi:hypothetical protein
MVLVNGESGRMCEKLLWHYLKLRNEIFLEKQKNAAVFESLTTGPDYEVVILSLCHSAHNPDITSVGAGDVLRIQSMIIRMFILLIIEFLSTAGKSMRCQW